VSGEPIYPGALWYPGINAGYNAGRNDMRAVVCHYTVGYNSLDLLAREGTCQFLISRGGASANSPDGRATVWQLAEADATCWHAGSPFNSLGPGLEAERYDEEPMLTDEQIDAIGGLVRWLGAEHGIPLDYYDTGGDNDLRIPDHHGFLSHRACLQSGDWHYDYWHREDWARMVAPAAPLPPPRAPEDEMSFTATDANNVTWLFAGAWRRPITWDQANALAELAEPIKYQGAIGDTARDAFEETTER
jgi:hypothetical protein